ncbi:hypothetical protein HH213_22380 [Duganella dendranthematis]|uniref:Transmembrane protein n=1 Tax=Duganella dendranthematis TaxID=2728021 RepID=A0ABX6ME52_9BURK|nr:DUF6622 family protein [Duganella dendranthematis]QJD92593.1 hypothetical protein HH213_22380 [Duganella dendranthematis]
MIQQIVSHTPVYVWALLAFLIYRGWLASQDRETSLRKVALIPLVMVGLSVTSINGHGPLGDGVWALWALGAVASAAAIWQLSPREIVVNRAAGTIVQRGSWMPLVLMIAIFATKYAVAVMSAMHPELPHSVPFAASVALLYGVFNGLFLGRLARYAAAWQRQPVAVAAL